MRFCILTTLWGNRGLLATAGAALFLLVCMSDVGAATDVTALYTSSLRGAGSMQTAAGDGNDWMFPSSRNYDMTWEGKVSRIDRLQTATGIYAASGLANVFIRRTEGAGNDILWYKADAATDRREIRIESEAVADGPGAFGGRNLLVGSDNLFANRGDPTGNNSNVERLDFIFSAGFSASDTRGFSIFDRGNANDHDGFRITAITALDDAAVPSGYGDVLTFRDGEWGNADLVEESTYLVVRRDRRGASSLFRPSNVRTQSIGGVFIPTTDLASTGTTIYGYSLLAPDTQGTGAELLDWLDASHYPRNTLNDDDYLAGGLDPVGLSAVLFTAVPEPTSMLGFVGGSLLLLRRR